MATILICGFGPGISSAVAEKFGAAGFSVALVARNAERLDAGVKALDKKGIKAAAFPTDVSDAAAVKAMVAKVRATMGPIGIVQWSAYGGAAGDLLSASTADLKGILDVAVVGLITAVQESLPDLEKEKGAVLVTNGGLGFFDPQSDALGVAWNAMGLSIANSAKHKAVRLLNKKLEPKNVYVGEVMVLGMVKGTAFDDGKATIEPSTVAAKFWDLYSARTPVSANVG